MHIQLSLVLLSLATLVAGERLPTGVQVYRYNLHLNFTENTFTRFPYEYEGYLEIRFTLSSAYPHDIKMNAAHDFITIKSAFIQVAENVTEVTSFDIDDNDVLTLGDTQKANQTLYYCYLFINYTSRLSVDDMYGLYRTTYDSNGQTKYMAASQFTPVFARRVFPCMDEPTFKTYFRLNVTHPSNMEAYFNTAVNVTETDDALKLTTTYFRTSGAMATYMAGLFVISADDFTCTVGENFTSSSVYYYRDCSRSGLQSARDFALEIGPLIMEELYNITDYEYGIIMGFQKMDLLALPSMATNALENWGVITYREQDLLLDADNCNNLDKQNIAQMLTFEMAQMWFGNMATPEWWHYTYMTKGLAHYLQYLVTQRVFEDWDLNQQFIYRVLQPALELDSLRYSPALRAPANSTDEIMTKFDKISLLKGASLYRMLNDVIAGYKNFRQGLEYFLTSFSYRTTQPQGLWNLISAQVNLDNRDLLPPNKYLKDALIDWEVNPGFPLLEVTREEGIVIVKQKGRFLYTGLNENYQWYVPVSYVFSSNLTDFDNTTLNQYSLPNTTFEIELPSADEEWVMLNRQAAGYYRVHYGDMWLNISSAIHASQFSGIPESNRAQLLDDVFALARANILSYSFLFDFTDYLAEEESLYPWMTAFRGVDYILRRVGSTSALGLQIEARFLTYLSKIYATIPWSTLDENNQAYSVKQIEILSQACRIGYVDCVKNAVSQFNSFKSSGTRPHKNLRSIVYCSGLLYGTDSTNWDALWSAYSTTNIAAEKVKILSALGCTEHENLLQKSLALTLNETAGITRDDASLIFISAFTNSKNGVNESLQFLINNHQAIAKRYQGMNTLRTILLGLAEYLSGNDQTAQFREFLQKTDSLAEEFTNAANQALEIADVNAIWLDNHLNELNQYFQIGLEEDPVPPTTISSSTISTTTTTSSFLPDSEESLPGRGTKRAASFILVALTCFIILS